VTRKAKRDPEPRRSRRARHRRIVAAPGTSLPRRRAGTASPVPRSDSLGREREGTLGCPPRLPSPLSRAAPDASDKYWVQGAPRQTGVSVIELVASFDSWSPRAAISSSSRTIVEKRRGAGSIPARGARVSLPSSRPRSAFGSREAKLHPGQPAPRRQGYPLHTLLGGGTSGRTTATAAG
jgi:hypothetical protein